MPDSASAPKPRLTATQISVFVAALSLCTALYQGYLNTRAVGVFSRDVTHRETMRACRETVEFFMDAKLRIQRIGEAPGAYSAREQADIVFEARRAVARYAAVATYLANFSAEARRARYSEITQNLEAMINAAATGGKPASFEPVDQKFYMLNEDCVASVGMSGN